MLFLTFFLVRKVISFLILASGDKAVSFGVYEIRKSPTPLGWALIIILSLAVIFGRTYLAARILKRLKLK